MTTPCAAVALFENNHTERGAGGRGGLQGRGGGVEGTRFKDYTPAC